MTGQPGLLPVLLPREGRIHQQGWDFSLGAKTHHGVGQPVALEARNS